MTSLANPDGLPWETKIKTRGQEILSKSCSKEALEKQRNAMMDNFAQILQ